MLKTIRFVTFQFNTEEHHGVDVFHPSCSDSTTASIDIITREQQRICVDKQFKIPYSKNKLQLNSEEIV